MSASNERAIAGLTAGQIGRGDGHVAWDALPDSFHHDEPCDRLDRPLGFGDEQVRGPFRSFHHEHIFEPLDGATRMIDCIRFDAPLDPIGRLAERAVAASYLPKLIAVPGQYLKAEVERRNRAAEPPR
jgi:hypothetical protein